MVRDTAKLLVDERRPTDASIDQVLADLRAPSLQLVRIAARQLARRRVEQRVEIRADAEAIVTTQSTVDPAEADALGFLRKRCDAGA